MSTQHTPGPWVWYWRNEDGEANCGVFWHERMAYSVCRAPRYETQEQWEANARLIAAAPDLLETLMELVEIASVLEPTCLGNSRAKENRMDRARAAIAKAIGEQA